MKNLEEINFTEADFELLQKALGAASLAESKNSLFDLMLDNMPIGNPIHGGPLGTSGFFEGFRKDMESKQKAAQKMKNEEFEEKKITLQYKLIQFKKILNTPVYQEPRYTAKEWQRIMDEAKEFEKDHPDFESTEPQKKSQESAFSEES